MGSDQPTGSAVSVETESEGQEEIGSANDSTFGLPLRPVRVLRLNRGAERIERAREENKDDELWLGSAYDPNDPDGDDIGVYVRIANPMPVVAELMCAVIGRSMGLPVPEPFLVSIDKGGLPASGLLPQEKPALAFASLNVGGQTFSQLLRGDSPTMQTMLMKWEHMIPVATFDEWMANRDRNLSNILFVANVLWIIDHAEAFHGKARGLFGLTDLIEDQSSNILGDILAKCSPSECAVHLEAAQAWLSKTAFQVDVQEAATCADIDYWQTPEQKAELLDFVTKRLTLTHRLLCTRLGHPQLPH